MDTRVLRSHNTSWLGVDSVRHGPRHPVRISKRFDAHVVARRVNPDGEFHRFEVDVNGDRRCGVEAGGGLGEDP